MQFSVGDRRQSTAVSARPAFALRFPGVALHSDPVRVVAFNTAEQWAEDVSEDIAREIQRRIDLAGDELPFSIEAFIEMHAGPSRQLSWRLL